MFNRLLGLVITTGIVTLSAAVYAISVDREGNYISAEEGSGYHVSWLVVTGRLNCRKSPGKDEQTFTQYVDGDRLRADTNDGQSNPILLDGESKSWLRVKSDNGICYVRARDTYIIPSR